MDVCFLYRLDLIAPGRGERAADGGGGAEAEAGVRRWVQSMQGLDTAFWGGLPLPFRLFCGRTGQPRPESGGAPGE